MEERYLEQDGSDFPGHDDVEHTPTTSSPTGTAVRDEEIIHESQIAGSPLESPAEPFPAFEPVQSLSSADDRYGSPTGTAVQDDSVIYQANIADSPLATPGSEYENQYDAYEPETSRLHESVTYGQHNLQQQYQADPYAQREALNAYDAYERPEPSSRYDSYEEQPRSTAEEPQFLDRYADEQHENSGAAQAYADERYQPAASNPFAGEDYEQPRSTPQYADEQYQSEVLNPYAGDEYGQPKSAKQYVNERYEESRSTLSTQQYADEPYYQQQDSSHHTSTGFYREPESTLSRHVDPHEDPEDARARAEIAALNAQFMNAAADESPLASPLEGEMESASTSAFASPIEGSFPGAKPKKGKKGKKGKKAAAFEEDAEVDSSAGVSASTSAIASPIASPMDGNFDLFPAPGAGGKKKKKGKKNAPADDWS